MKHMTSNLNDKTQHGGVAIVMVFIVLVIITGMLVTVLSLSSSAVSDSSHQNFRTKSMYMAESAIEHAEYKLVNSTVCASIATASQTLGAGSFEILSGAVGAAANECVVTVKGVQNGFVHTFTRTVSFSANSNGFNEIFPTAVDFGNDWTGKVLGNAARMALDWDGATNTADGSGSMMVQIMAVKFNPKDYSGTIRKVFATPLDASAGPVTLSYSFNLMSFADSTPVATQNIEILVAKGNAMSSIWDSGTAGYVMTNDQVWSTTISGTTVIPQGNIYDDFVVQFDLRAPKKWESSYIFIDDIDVSW